MSAAARRLRAVYWRSLAEFDRANAEPSEESLAAWEAVASTPPATPARPRPWLAHCHEAVTAAAAVIEARLPMYLAGSYHFRRAAELALSAGEQAAQESGWVAPPSYVNRAGAVVIGTRGLPDGFVPPNMSLEPPLPPAVDDDRVDRALAAVMSLHPDDRDYPGVVRAVLAAEDADRARTTP